MIANGQTSWNPMNGYPHSTISCCPPLPRIPHSTISCRSPLPRIVRLMRPKPALSLHDQIYQNNPFSELVKKESCLQIFINNKINNPLIGNSLDLNLNWLSQEIPRELLPYRENLSYGEEAYPYRKRWEVEQQQLWKKACSRRKIREVG